MNAAVDVARSRFCAARLQRVFEQCFAEEYRTRLVGGVDEPLYQPAADGEQWHRLYFREDFFASALHEIAHWCIAGAERRLRLDFGYWYAPEGRNASQQRAFESVESRPQALEWLFARASGYRFRLSADNLSPDGEMAPQDEFARAVLTQARSMVERGLPPRAQRFYDGLCVEFGTRIPSDRQRFELSQLI